MFPSKPGVSRTNTGGVTNQMINNQTGRQRIEEESEVFALLWAF
jgi:hypothetical protein